MNQLLSLLFLLLPMFVGYLLPIKSKPLLSLIDKSVGWSVYIILWVMGVGLAHLDNLGGDAFNIILYAVLFLIAVLFLNGIAMMIFDFYFPWQNHIQQNNEQKHKPSVSGSLKQILCVIVGVISGMIFPFFRLPENTVSYLLMILLFLIGIGLRNNGIALHSVLLNKRGLQLALINIVATLGGGLILGFIIGLPLMKSLALSSGFGWYSLSGSIMTQAYGPFWGAVALLCDLGREFVALMFIPVLMRRFPSLAISTGGATALDFTLPTIYRAGGSQAATLAIAYSFIINIVSPVLLIFFSGIK